MEEDVVAALQTLALSVLSLMGLCLNGLIVLLLYRKHNMRTFSNRFVLSLSCSHLLQCIFIIPILMMSIQGVEFIQIWCRMTTFLTIFLNLASVFSILLIAVDRNCAVNSPLHYTITITKKRTGILIISTWLIAFVLAIPILVVVPETSNIRCFTNGLFLLQDQPGILNIAYTSAISIVGFLIPFINVAFLYFAMFKAAKNNNARAGRSNSNSSASNEIIVNLKPPKKLGVTEYTLRRNFSSDHVEPKDSGCCFAGKHKAAVTGLLVVMSFFACWLPFYATLVSDLFHPAIPHIKYCVNLAAYMSCIINPYLYFFRNKNTWKESKKFVVTMLTRKNKFDNNRNLKKTTIELSSCLFRMPTSQSQPVLATNTARINTLCGESPSMNMSVMYQENQTHSMAHSPIKTLAHQDSCTSNDSSDAYATTVVIGSVPSSDEDSMIWYQPFHSTMVDVPLHQDDKV
ncbi:g_PROTEIN_RECEP_F1_2 domain-containing protein [Caerostris darwini]|uniref:G_PROTEIN_RECEP_F1_2 domain-containing protein n=1 Tax=Caerostris darwini TaxID=1538125 RepID=A0AAV4SJJ8_9ARAC|nr:g_PROTEIN_RECEP_F1_2 domain-containing protein [Caerostris darwini]